MDTRGVDLAVCQRWSDRFRRETHSQYDTAACQFLRVNNPIDFSRYLDSLLRVFAGGGEWDGRLPNQPRAEMPRVLGPPSPDSILYDDVFDGQSVFYFDAAACVLYRCAP
jgi:hypothetical protein